MKKILFSLVALFVAINSWGYSKDAIIKGYDSAGKEIPGFLFFVVDDDNTKNLHTVGVAQCTLSGDVTVPGKILAENKVEFTVVRSSPQVSGTVISKHPTTFTGTVTNLTFEEGLQTFHTNGLTGCTAKTITLPKSVSTVGDENGNSFPNLTNIYINSDNPNFEVWETSEGADIVVAKRNVGSSIIQGTVSFIVFKNKSGEAVTTLTFPENVTWLEGLHFMNGDYKRVTTVNLPSTFQGFKTNVTQSRHSFMRASHTADYSGIKEFTVAVGDGNGKYCAHDGILYEKPFAVVGEETKPWGQTLVLVPEDKDFDPKTFTIPDGVTKIDSLACVQNRNFNHLEIPEGVESVGAGAFDHCSKMTQISIPATATYLGEGFLAATSALAKIIVADDNPNYSVYDDVLYAHEPFDPDKHEPSDPNIEKEEQKKFIKALACPGAKGRISSTEANGTHALHPNTEEIGKGAFENCDFLVSLDLTTATNLQYIREKALSSMDRVRSLTIPGSVKLIEYCALQSACLTSLTFEETTDTNAELIIEDRWITSAATEYHIDTMTFPAHLKILGRSQGEPDEVTRAVSYARKVTFAEGCKLEMMGRFSTLNDNLEEVDLSNCTHLTNLSENCFAGLTTLTNVKLSSSITTLGKASFARTTNLQHVDFNGAQITEIGDNTFDSSGILDLDLPQSVQKVGREAFVSCKNLKTVNIPASATSIHSEAFKYCDNLVEFTVAEGNTEYASSDGMLTNKEKKTLLIFPPGKASTTFTLLSPSFEKIGDYAFYACTRLENIVIPKKVTTIGNYAFEFCDNLNSITFLTDAPMEQLEEDVKKNNDDAAAAKNNNLADHRFGNLTTSPADFLKNKVTINIRKNGNEGKYNTGYWKDCKKTYSFTAKNSQVGKEEGNSYEYLAMSTNTVGVLKSFSTNHTAVVPATVKNGQKEYSVGMVGDYAFEDAPATVKEVVFLGPIEYVGSNAFNNGHKDNVYTEVPTSTIESIFFTNATVGKNELSTVRFELGVAYGTQEYPEFASTQKIYVPKSVESTYKESWTKFAKQIDYKIPGIKIGTKFGTFSREFDVDLCDVVEGKKVNWNTTTGHADIVAFTGFLEQVNPYDNYTYIRMRSINCNSESVASTGDGDGTYIPANTGVLLRAYTEDAKTPANFYYRIGESKKDYDGKTFSTPAANVMVKVVEDKEVIQPTDGDYTNYIISGGQYHALGAAGTLAVHKSYMHVYEPKPSNGVKVLFDGDEEATGIEEINAALNESGNDVIYNLNGQRVNGSIKGIVIKNGKKVIM